MNESTTTTPPVSLAKPSRLRRFAWPLVVVVLGLIIAGFFASRAGLDKVLVKQKLDAFIAAAREQARARGRDIEITYSDLDVVGGLTHKHVQVHSVVLRVQPLRAQPLAPGVAVRPDVMQVTTPLLEIYPESADLSALRVSLPSPIDFALQDAPDRSLLKITASSAHDIFVTRESENGTAYNRVRYSVPEQTAFTYLRENQATGAEDATPKLESVYETLRLQVAAGGAVDTRFAADGSHLGTASVALGQITITPQAAPLGAVTVAQIKGEWSNTLNAQKQNVMHVLANAGPLSAPAELLPFAPLALALDATYVGPMPQTPEAVASIQNQESVITLSHFTATAKDAGISATANFTANASDVLPVGSASVNLTNVPFLLERLHMNGVLDESREALLNAGLVLITGTPVADLKDSTIAVERARGGAFKIGKTTFEELFATFLKIALSHSKAAIVPTPAAKPLAPQLPDAAKPKSQPLPIHDPSVRG